MIRPPCLAAGDVIGVISPSAPIASEAPARFERGVRNLQAMGFEVRLAENAGACQGHTAGTIEERLRDIHSLFADPSVRAVIASVGGLNSNLTPSRRLIYEQVRWDVDDDHPRRGVPHRGPRTVRAGAAEGRIVAGNLSTLLLLAGSPYWPGLEGAILCIEEDESEGPASFDRLVTQLRTMGALQRIGALLVGRVHPQAGFTRRDSLRDILLTATRGFDLPIAVDFDFGHTDPMFILPNGVRARVEFAEAARLELLESACAGGRGATAGERSSEPLGAERGV